MTKYIGMRAEKGFTLIELLVALAIIGIVFGAILSTFDAVRRNSRDAKRQSDLRAIQSALQHYFADQNFYPYVLNLTTALSLTSNNGNPVQTTPPKFTYLHDMPKDPSNVTQYLYEARPSSCDNISVRCTDYCLFAKLESQITQPSSSVCTPVSPRNFYLTQP